MQIKSTRTNHTDQQWQYGTMAVHAFKAVPDEQRWFYSQFALEDGNNAASLASGAATALKVAMSLAGAGDSVIVSTFAHGGTFHQFKIIPQRMGIETRFCDSNDLPKVRSLVDQRTKFIFTETIGNPKFSIADLEPWPL
ncbi:hypothetical protein MCOR03_003785 [Pyricularia oryzae]|nr:hypothetical protein MCOR22_000824 [Pyricularia oryzae]KAI6561664.1 hypothetical protein MCOR03_003785 [Pyricularia oryzae]